MRATPLVLALGAALLLGLRPGVARAQTIGGVVLEDSTRMPIAGADVSPLLESGEAGPTVRTDSAGGFLLKLAEAGKVTLRVTHPSYRALTSDTVDVDKGEAVTVELHLGRDAIPLKPLVVTARVDADVQAFHERVAKGTGFGHFITRRDIDRRPGAKVTDLLRFMPGVRVIGTPACNGCSVQDVVYMRGGGAAGLCAPTILVDGLQVKQDAVFTLDAFLMPDMLEGAEVYTDPAGVPASLGVTTNPCGVIAFWTRTPEGHTPLWLKLVTGGAAVGLFLLLIAVT